MSTTRTLIGRGIYDSDEIARLTGVPVRDVSRWASAPEHGGGLLFPVDRRLFTFWDLITVRVTATLLGRKVPLSHIRDARDHLTTKVDSDWPLAHFAVLSRIANVGRSVYVGDGDDGEDWFDATLGGQLPLDVVVEPLLQRLKFENHKLATEWSPREGIVLRPTVGAGTPCVEGTRIPTALLADLAAQGESVVDLADDYELTPDVVRRAIAYETDPARAA
jgi:uncharacterized protein (DUF433 family)